MKSALNEHDRKSIIEIYESRYKAMGASYKSIGWGSKEDQNLRFEMLFRDINPENKVILDVGCGFGDLISYIENRFTKDFSYIGLDISEKFIDHAKKKYGDTNRTFLVGELSSIVGELDSKIKLPNIDICVISGLFNYKIENNLLFLQNNMGELFDLSSQCLAMNFLSTYVDYQLEKNFHFKPEDVFSLAKSLTKHVTLFHDYPLWEFTIQLHNDTYQNIDNVSNIKTMEKNE